MNRKSLREVAGLKVSTRKKLEKIMSVLRLVYDVDNGSTIEKAKIRAVIVRVCGHDPRTVKLYFELLEMEGYIAPINPKVYVILEPDSMRIEDFNIPGFKVEKTE
jgi:hypothetical protein